MLVNNLNGIIEIKDSTHQYGGVHKMLLKYFESIDAVLIKENSEVTKKGVYFKEISHCDETDTKGYYHIYRAIDNGLFYSSFYLEKFQEISVIKKIIENQPKQELTWAGVVGLINGSHTEY